jgi:hypothetical protein
VETALLRFAAAALLRFAEAALPRFAEAALLRPAETRAKPVSGVFAYLFHSTELLTELLRWSRFFTRALAQRVFFLFFWGNCRPEGRGWQHPSG